MKRYVTWGGLAPVVVIAGVVAVGRLAAGPAPAAGAPSATQPATRPATQPATQPAAIDPRARDILRAAAQYLDAAKSFTFSADIWEDVALGDGRKVQRQRTTQVGVRRPDRVYAESHNERIARGLWYDGQTVTICNRQKNFYGTVEAPHTIDQMIAFVGDRFGIATPMADLLASDVYTDLTHKVTRGDYLGRQTVHGVRCHHLAFVQPDLDWEMWVEDAGAPVIHKLVISYTAEEGAPQFTATLSDWNFDARLPDYAFTFRPPLGASRIAVLPAAPEPPERGDQGAAGAPGVPGIPGAAPPQAGAATQPSQPRARKD